MKLKIKLFVLNIIRFFSGKKIIVSLTSYPARYENLHLVIESLLNQKLKANKIVLYLYEGEAVALPDSLLKLQSKKFEIVRVNENIRPHKKYYYAFKDFPNDLIITVDDDYIYPDDLVMNLYRVHLKYRDAVVCGRCRKICFDIDEKVLPYNDWPLFCNDSKPKKGLIATGVGGVLYQPRLLDERVLDMDKLKKLALNQDDMWLKIMEILKGIKTVPASMNWSKAKSLGSESTLFSVNELGANDECFGNLLKYYDISENMFID